MVEEETTPEIYDSLPYYDDELERFPELKEVVDREFAKVPKPPSTLHPKVPPEPNLFAVRSAPFNGTSLMKVLRITHYWPLN